MKKMNIKHIALSIVAVILILILSVGVTYGWIDDVKLVEFENDDLVDNGAPLKSGVDINSTVKMSSDTSIIDLGYMLNDEDLTYTYVEDGVQKRHTKYDGGSNAPDWNKINKNKGYFYESGDMHLSGCYSDGESFYFPMHGSQSGFREGNKDDENVNYISFTTKVSSPYANIDFWFRNEPTICKKNTDNKITKARYAIIVDGKSHVYSSTGEAKTCNSGLTGTTPVSGVRTTADYIYNSDSNTTTERGKNSNTLFSVAKGDTVNLTIKIWLEDGYDTSITASDINFQLVSSWAYNRTITIVDKTTTNGSASWINNNSAKLFLTCPSILNDYAKEIYNTNSPSVGNWKNIPSTEGYEKAPFKQLTLKSGTTDTYTVEIPLCFNNEEMILYRCAANGWNNGSHSGILGTYGVKFWNWWGTYLPNTYKNETYTLYGSSYDEVATQGFSGTATYKGYGTWGSVEEIKVYSHYGSTDYAPRGQSNENRRLYLRDYSDYSSSGNIYTYVMYRPDDNSTTPWKCYVPSSSAKLQFDYYSSNKISAVWGYNSWNNINPQQRPLKSTGLYSSNSTVYHFAQHYGTDDYRNGWGYWEGAETVYLIKSSFLSNSNTVAHAYMFNSSSDNKQEYPGETLTRLKDTNNNDVSFTWNGGSTTAEVWKTDSPCVYKYIVFNNGYGGDVGTDKTGDLALFPGCFYQVDGSKWYGSLNDTGRGAIEESSSSGGESGGESDGSISGYSIETDIVFKLNNISYEAYRKNDNSNSYKVRIPLSSGGNNWVTVLNGYINYGREQSSQYTDVPNSNNMDFVLKRYHSNNFSLRASSAGNYICTFEFNDGNTNEIKLVTCVKEG